MKTNYWSLKLLKVAYAIIIYVKFCPTTEILECKAEYVKRFVSGSIGQMTWNTCKERVGPPIDKTIPDSGPLSPSCQQRLAPLEISDDEAGSLGFMHKRDDYEKEFDNDAEKLVSQLVFSPDDEDVDVCKI
jgi:transcriptional adapter 2-beta